MAFDHRAHVGPAKNASEQRGGQRRRKGGEPPEHRTSGIRAVGSGRRNALSQGKHCLFHLRTILQQPVEPSRAKDRTDRHGLLEPVKLEPSGHVLLSLDMQSGRLECLAQTAIPAVVSGLEHGAPRENSRLDRAAVSAPADLARET